jgi:methylmalonyl-CoA mutase
MKPIEPYQPKHKVRIVTAASLFDGHDAAINVMRRIIQSTGCEVIHLGHDRSVEEVVDTAIQEDAQAIAMTSYQGGHIEYFKYMKAPPCSGCPRTSRSSPVVAVSFLPHDRRVAEVRHRAHLFARRRRAMVLQGMINDLVAKSDFATGASR